MSNIEIDAETDCKERCSDRNINVFNTKVNGVKIKVTRTKKTRIEEIAKDAAVMQMSMSTWLDRGVRAVERGGIWFVNSRGGEGGKEGVREEFMKSTSSKKELVISRSPALERQQSVCLSSSVSSF